MGDHAAVVMLRTQGAALQAQVVSGAGGNFRALAGAYIAEMIAGVGAAVLIFPIEYAQGAHVPLIGPVAEVNCGPITALHHGRIQIIAGGVRMVHGIGSFPEAGKVQGNELLAGNGRTGGVGGKIVLLGVVGVELAHIGVGAAVQIVGSIRQAAQRRKAVSLGAAWRRSGPLRSSTGG